MIVVADTSPLNYLILIGEADLLHRLYGQVLVPAAVLLELEHPQAPVAVKDWIQRRPGWLQIREVALSFELRDSALDKGEAEAIALAEESRSDVLLLIDDETGRNEASRRGIRTTGTLGVLNDAAAREFVDLAAALKRLRRTNFRIAASFLDELLARHRQDS